MTINFTTVITTNAENYLRTEKETEKINELISCVPVLPENT